MQRPSQKLNQLLAKERAAKRREELLLYLVNMESPYLGWQGAHSAWSREEHRDFTNRLREATQEHWPELWTIEKQNTPIEERAWEIALRMQKYLRAFWAADNDYARDWHIHRAREYHYRLHILPQLLDFDERMRPIRAEELLNEPPAKNDPFAKALYDLQVRAKKSSRAPRVCPNDCERRYFLSTKKGQRYCPDCRRSEAAKKRMRASKLTSYHRNKNNWPSTAERRKHRG
jgi:hypothetical protein